MKHINRILLISCIALVFVPQQLLSKSTGDFNFPRSIRYKILRNTQYVSTNTLKFGKKGLSTVLVSIDNFLSLNGEKLIAYVNGETYSLFSILIMRQKQVLHEWRIKKNSGLGLLDGNVISYKDYQETNPSISQIGTSYRVIDMLSSFFILSNKISTANFETEQFHFISGKSVITVNSIVDRNIPIQYKSDKICTTKITLKHNLESEKNKQMKYLDIVSFNVYYDRKRELWFPIHVRIEDNINNNQYQLIAIDWIRQ